MKCLYTEEQIDRFWSHVRIRGVNDCWPWLLSKHFKGYGQVGLTADFENGRRHRMLKTHKVAYEITHDLTIDLGVHGLHTCDVPSCCNPRHVYIGTNDDNVRDRNERGRGARGEAHGRVKLKEHDVKRIRLRLKDTSHRILALMHNVSPGCITSISSGRSWAWL